MAFLNALVLGGCFIFGVLFCVLADAKGAETDKTLAFLAEVGDKFVGVGGAEKFGEI